MKVTETATIIFKFKDLNSKKEAWEKLNEFLKKEDWITEEGFKRPPLVNIHTYDSGNCEVVLSDDKITDDYVDLIDELYDSLIGNEDVMWIKILYSEAVSKLFYNHAYKYSKYQTNDLLDLKPLNEYFIFIRR